MVKSHKDIPNHYYGFVNLPNQWISDNDRSYPDRFFDDKNYEDFYFDNFYDMDEMFGHENSLFGTKGLPVGHPDRSSKSFDVYTKKHGPMIVRVIKKNDLQEQIRTILRETLESKWNKGNYDYQYGYCHYLAYNVIGKIRKMFPKNKVNYYLLLAQEIDELDETIVQDYLVHTYIKIDNMLLDSNGLTTMDEAWKRLEEWEERQRYLVPEMYRTEIFDEETNEIPEYFFNNTFCNTGRVKKDMEEFLNNPIVKRILRDK